MRIRAFIGMLLIASCSPVSADAENAYILESASSTDRGLREYDMDMGLRVRTGSYNPAWPLDMAIAASGRIFLGGDCVSEYDWTRTVDGWYCWYGASRDRRGWSVAFFANGELAVLEPFTDPPTLGFEVLAPDASVRQVVRSASGLGLIALDVPRAGAHEDGVIALAVEGPSPGRYYVIRWKRGADGAFIEEGPFGPLDVVPFYESSTSRFGFTRHIAVTPDGQRLLIPDPLRERVIEVDLEGRLARVFASVPEDPTALPIGPPISADAISNLAVSRTGRVLILTARRAYYFEADGTLIRRLDDILRIGFSVAFTEPIPFESAGASCEPWSTGFWKRQCASVGASRRASSSRGPLRSAASMPPLHPAFRDGRLPGVIARADEWLEPYSTTACGALHPEQPSDWRQKALRRYAAVALNVADRRLGLRCAMDEAGPRTVGEILDEVRALLAGSSADEHREAFQLCGLLLGEDGE